MQNWKEKQLICVGYLINRNMRAAIPALSRGGSGKPVIEGRGTEGRPSAGADSFFTAGRQWIFVAASKYCSIIISVISTTQFLQ